MADDDFKRSYHLRTVCEVTREIYDILQRNKKKLPPDFFNGIMDRLKEQMRMQKKMDAKLKSYKCRYEQEMYKPNHDHEEDEKRRSIL